MEFQIQKKDLISQNAMESYKELGEKTEYGISAVSKFVQELSSAGKKGNVQVKIDEIIYTGVLNSINADKPIVQARQKQVAREDLDINISAYLGDNGISVQVAYDEVDRKAETSQRIAIVNYDYKDGTVNNLECLDRQDIEKKQLQSQRTQQEGR